MRHNQPCDVCCTQLDKWKDSHMTCVLKGSTMSVRVCVRARAHVCVRACPCVALTPTPPHGNITKSRWDKIPAEDNFSYSTVIHAYIIIINTVIITVLLLFFHKYYWYYQPTCGCPAWGGWVGWCRIEAHVSLNGLTAALLEWPSYCECATYTHTTHTNFI